MGLFGRKKKVEPPPIEDIPPLPTLETLHQETGHPQNASKMQSDLESVKRGIENHNMRSQHFAKAQQPAKMPPITADILPKTKPKELQHYEKHTQVSPKMEENASHERSVFAPLFVKIDRYRNILSALGQIRTSIAMIRNSFSTLNELERARMETLKLIEDAVNKVETKISALDSELLRPTGALPEATPEYHDVETVQATVADLKGQIEQMKSELERMS